MKVFLAALLFAAIVAVGVSLLLNTIQTPNDRQYPFSACRLDGNPLNYPDSGFAYGSSSAHPDPSGNVTSAIRTSKRC